MTDYDFELDKVAAEVKKSKARRVGLQFPEGLKDRALEIARFVEAKTGAKAVIVADPIYGACDMKRGAMEKLGVDFVVHFGHTRFEP